MNDDEEINEFLDIQEEEEKFLFNNPLTLYSISKLYNFDINEVEKYRNILLTFLKKYSKITVDVDSPIDEDIEWISLPRNNGYISHYIFIYAVDKIIHRLCLVISTTTNDGLLITNCSPLISSLTHDWLEKSFDCQINNLVIPPSLLINEYEKYITRMITTRNSVTDSQIIFSSPTSTPELKTITVALPGEDVLKIHNIIKPLSNNKTPSSTTQSNTPPPPSLIDAILQHLSKHTAVYFQKLLLKRINCGGFILTTTGKLKFFKRDYNLNDANDFITDIIKYSR